MADTAIVVRARVEGSSTLLGAATMIDADILLVFVSNHLDALVTRLLARMSALQSLAASRRTAEVLVLNIDRARNFDLVAASVNASKNRHIALDL